MITIVGPSGSGKSTILKLIAGILTPTEGTVEINKVDLSRIDLAMYRKSLGVVMQEDKLLSGTIEDNICFFDSCRDFELIKSCAIAACLEKDIISSPMGYNTLVGDMGSTLSGGQKQRLIIARSLYRNPRVLLMDEGTANLDIELEFHISNYIRSLNSTRIMIAHRPRLAEISDRVFRLVDSNLVEICNSEGHTVL